MNKNFIGILNMWIVQPMKNMKLTVQQIKMISQYGMTIMLDFVFRFILLEYKLVDMQTTANLEIRDTVFIVTQKILRMNIILYVYVLVTLKLDANILIKTFMLSRPFINT